MITINMDLLDAFRGFLAEQERQPATVNKYVHDISVLANYADGAIYSKTQLIGFRKYLEERDYNNMSINSMLAAVNKFMEFCGVDWRVQYEKVQRKMFLSVDKELCREEYERLVHQAEAENNMRLAMLTRTLCVLGIRVSELIAITVESLGRGQAEIQNKGKIRTILIPDELAVKLRDYCETKGIITGPVFITRSGKPIDRSNIWKMLKKLGERARVAAEKVFPHNLRHLFACIYYEIHKDIVGLASILGHSSIDTTRIYTVRSGREERQRMSQLRLVC